MGWDQLLSELTTDFTDSTDKLLLTDEKSLFANQNYRLPGSKEMWHLFDRKARGSLGGKG